MLFGVKVVVNEFEFMVVAGEGAAIIKLTLLLYLFFVPLKFLDTLQITWWAIFIIAKQ